MKKILLILGLFLTFNLTFGQTTVGIFKLPNATTQFGKIKPIGTIVYDESAKKFYRLTEKGLATSTLSTVTKELSEALPYYLNSDSLILTDLSGVDSVFVFDDGDTTRFESDNPIRIDGIVSNNLDMNSNVISNLLTPSLDNDAANKNYVDISIASLSILEFFSTTVSDIGGIYRVMDNVEASVGTVTSASLGAGDDQAAFNFATLVNEPGLITLTPGEYHSHIHGFKTGTKPVSIYFELYKRTTLDVETLVGTSDISSPLASTVSLQELFILLNTPVTLDITDRLVVKWFANVGITGTDITVNLSVGDVNNSHLAFSLSGASVSELYVPYFGAIKNIDIGANNFTVGDTAKINTISATELIIDADSVKVSGNFTSDPMLSCYEFQDSSVVLDLTVDIWVRVTNPTKTLFTSIEDEDFVNAGDTVVAIDYCKYASLFYSLSAAFSDNDIFKISILKNGTTRIDGSVFSGKGTTATIAGKCIIPIVIGDYFELQVINTTDNDDVTVVSGSIIIIKEF